MSFKKCLKSILLYKKKRINNLKKYCVKCDFDKQIKKEKKQLFNQTQFSYFIFLRMVMK